MTVPIISPRRKPIPKGQLLINGEWVDARDGATMPTMDPTTEETITTVAKASAADAEAAIDAASRAYEQGPWGKMRHEDRARILFKMADLLDERAEDFAIREAMDMGMPYTDFIAIIMPHCSGLSASSRSRPWFTWTEATAPPTNQTSAS
jgi:aldehyde dehydrogenase (NAD+)